MALPQRTVLIWGGIALLVVGLGVALAMTGSQLDNARLDQLDMETEFEELESEVDALAEERDLLQRQVDDQLKSIEQLKVELDRARGQQATPAAP